jgi:hypothetical protein
MELLENTGPNYLVQLSRGYWLSQTLFVAHQIGIFEFLANGPKSAEEISTHFKLDPRATPIFLTALMTLGLLTRDNWQQYNNSPLSNQYLVKGRQDYMGDFISHTEYMKNYWEGLDQVLKSGQPAISKTAAGPDTSQINLFLKAMYQATHLVAQEIIDSVDMEGKNHLLDLGSGLAPISRLLLSIYPRLHVTLFDLPHIIKIVKEDNRTPRDDKNRLTYKEGDCRHDDYGDKIYDVILISQLIHMYDLDTNNSIFVRAHKALRSEGWLIIHDYVLTDDHTTPWQGALFSLNMQLGTWGGRNYSWEEIQTSLATIGFHNPRLKTLNGDTSLIIAIK